MAEDPKQEIELPFGGKTYKLRPTFAVISAVEAVTGQSSRTLGIKILRLEAGVVEIASVVAAVLKDQGGPSAPKCGEIIMDDGYDDLIIPLGEFLTRAIRGNKRHEAEAAKENANSGGSGPRTGE